MYSEEKIEEIYKELEEAAKEWETPIKDVAETYINLAKKRGNKKLLEALEKILNEIELKEQSPVQADESVQEELQIEEYEPTEENKLQIEVEEEPVYEDDEDGLQEEEDKDYEKWTDEEKEEYFQEVENYTNGFEFLLDNLMTEATAGHRKIMNNIYRKRFEKFIRSTHNEKISNGKRVENEEQVIKRLVDEYERVASSEQEEPVEIRILKSRLKVIQEREQFYR